MKTRFETINRQITLDTIAPNGRVGLLALATDFNAEEDLRRMLPSGVEVFTNRVTNANPMTLENLRAMAGDISRAAGGILPGLGVDVMIYGCTSGTVAIGKDKIRELIHSAGPKIPVTNPVEASYAAFNALNAKRISVLTPYIEPINQEMARLFSEDGYDICNISGFAFDSDIDATGIPHQVLYEEAMSNCDDEADLLFISCTGLRAASVVERIERDLGKPVVTSNQALVWHVLQLLKCDQKVEGFGKLFECSIV